MKRPSLAVYAWLGLGYAFFYLPIVLLVVNSFNASRIGSHWGGFSLNWYAALLEDRQVLDSAWLSVKIAFMSACGATLLGGLAGLALGRMGSFRGRTALSGMVAAPLVMPEVITGLSLLLLFVSLRSLIGWPEARGELTIAIGHITFCMAYVAVIVQSRVATMDASLEEAAMDLGGRPLQVLLDVTVPGIAPALVTGWLLAFTLSLDDLVISSFVSGPGANTLPMLIFSRVKLGVTPDINALAALIIATVTLGVVIAGILMFMQQRKALAAYLRLREERS